MRITLEIKIRRQKHKIGPHFDTASSKELIVGKMKGKRAQERPRQ